MKWRRLRLGLLAVTALSVLSLVPAPGWVGAYPPREPGLDDVGGQAVPRNDRFGLCFVSSAEAPAGASRYEKAVAAGAEWTRWPIYWGNVERSPGTLDWSAVDTVVAGDVSYGFSINAILLGTPSQYATAGLPGVTLPEVGKRPLPLSGLSDEERKVSPASSSPTNLQQPIFTDGTDVPGLGKAINPNNHWASFVYAVVSRYAPQIRHWEIWNEPDYPLFWNASVQDYYRLLKVAYIAAKFADPGCTVLMGGLAIYISPNWLESLLNVMKADSDAALRDGNGWYFDVLPLHIYSNSYETYYQVRRVRALLQSYGLGSKPIWINESGVPVWNDYPGPTWDPQSLYRATKEEQAAYVLQHYAYGFLAGAQRIFHFQLYDDCGNSPGGTNDVGDAYGLYRNPTNAPCFWSHSTPDTARPSYEAYQIAATYLQDAVPLWRRNPNGQHEEIAYYVPSTRQRVLFLWATRGTAVIAQVGATGAQGLVLDQEGSTQVLTPSGGAYTLLLPAATNRNLPDHTTYMIGGRPLLLVEEDTLPPAVTVSPLPAYSDQQIALVWQGVDEGSGVTAYDVFVSEDGGPLMPWLSGVQTTSAVYIGTPGRSYGFAVRGTDRAGNVGATPQAPQTQTVVLVPNQPSPTPSATPSPTATPLPTVTATATSAPTTSVSGRVLNLAGQPVPNSAVQITNAWGMPTTTQGDWEGKWHIAGLPKGDYGVAASHPGYGAWPARHLQLQQVVSGFDVRLAPLVNMVQNGDFEAGLGGWSMGGSTPVQVGEISFDGMRSAALGKDFIGQPELGGGGNSTLSQTFALPQTDEPLYLSLLYRLFSQEAEQGHDWFEILLIDGTTRHELLPPRVSWQTTADWQPFTYDLSPWRGRTVQLILNVWQDSPERFTLAYVDEVAVGSPNPASPKPTPTPTATPLPRRLWIPVVVR